MSNNVVVQIPCLNEESTIGDVVRDFKRNLPKSKIIVYDNNSIVELKTSINKNLDILILFYKNIHY